MTAARLAALLVLACACSQSDRDAARAADSAASAAQARIADAPHDVAVLDLGDLGEIRIELLSELAPKTVAHFESLAERGFYDGTNFHRVIPDFMIQGGDPLSRNQDPRDDGRGGSETGVPDEFSDYAQRRGTVSMAHSGSPDSARSQFFIVHQDSRHLDGGFTAFGRVVAGMETVDAVTRLAIDRYGRYGPRDRPYPVSAVIRRLRIERAATGAMERAATAPPASLAAPVPPG